MGQCKLRTVVQGGGRGDFPYLDIPKGEGGGGNLLTYCQQFRQFKI